MRVQLIVDAESPEELTGVAEAIASVMGEPDDGPEEAPATAATEAPRRGRGRKSAATAAAAPPASSGASTTSPGAAAAGASVTTAPIAPAPAALVAPASAVDPLAGGASAVSLEVLTDAVHAVIAKFGGPEQALAVTKRHGSPQGALGTLPPQNYGIVYQELQALLA